jgi:hypothetical protein
MLCDSANANGLDRVLFLKRVARHVNGRIEPWMAPAVTTGLRR